MIRHLVDIGMNVSVLYFTVKHFLQYLIDDLMFWRKALNICEL